MAFNPKRSETFARVINVEIPTDDPKKPNKGSFTVWFKYHNRKEALELSERMNAGELDDEAMLDRIAVKFAGIGNGEEFSQEDQRAAILDDVAICKRVFSEFLISNSEASGKN